MFLLFEKQEKKIIFLSKFYYFMTWILFNFLQNTFSPLGNTSIIYLLVPFFLLCSSEVKFIEMIIQEVLGELNKKLYRN